MMEKYVKRYFTLSRLLVSDFLLFNVLFWSSIKKFKVPGSQILESWVLSLGSWVPGPRAWDPGPGSWVLGSESWVLGSGSQVLGPGFWVVDPRSQVLGSGSWVLGPGFQVLGSYFRLCRFACTPNFFMKKNITETIQTNSILRLFIAKIILGKFNWICQMCYK